MLGGTSPKVWRPSVSYIGDAHGVGLTTPNFVLERALNRATQNLTETPPKMQNAPADPSCSLNLLKKRAPCATLGAGACLHWSVRAEEILPIGPPEGVRSGR